MLTFIKLGGSLITDKTRKETPRLSILKRLVNEISTVLDAKPELELLIGHGSGSYGHFAGRRYRTRDGVKSPDQWLGFAQVGAAAARLHQLVSASFLQASVPVLSLQPSASALCRDGQLQSLALEPIRASLESGLIPLLYGDVAFDLVRGGTIISTEEIFEWLAPHLCPTRILLLGQVPGVLDGDGQLIPNIHVDELESISHQLSSSHGVDVTGGMLSKVVSMLRLVESQPGLTVRILSGMEPDNLKKALVEEAPLGTLLS